MYGIEIKDFFFTFWKLELLYASISFCLQIKTEKHFNLIICILHTIFHIILQLDDATIMEKRVVKQSPNSPNQIRHLSSFSSGSRLDFDNYEFDDITDRACTIGTVHSTSIPNYEDPMDSKSGFVVAVEEEEIRKLCERVKVLEKERESMREVMDSMEVKKEKGVILKEIKQKLYEEAAPQKKRVVKRGNFFKRFSILPILKVVFYIYSLYIHCFKH